MGTLFAVGAALFLVPALASLGPGPTAEWIDPAFFAGSICFTSAATVQLVAAFEVPHRLRPGRHPRRLRPRSWMPARADWISAATQWPGTLLFNVNTFSAMDAALSRTRVDVDVWGPDMLGSACFLVSSLVAFANAEHRWLSWRPGDLDWWIASLNLGGSVAFAVSAIASYVEPATGAELNDAIAALGTAVGALGFLVGGLLLLPHAQRAELRAAVRT